MFRLDLESWSGTICWSAKSHLDITMERSRCLSIICLILLAITKPYVSSFSVIPGRPSVASKSVPGRTLTPVLTTSAASDLEDSNQVWFPTHYAGLAFDKYVDWCHRMPLRTKSISAMFILAFGDLIAQGIEAYKMGTPFGIDFARSRGFALAGLLFDGPWMHAWYEQVWR